MKKEHFILFLLFFVLFTCKEDTDQKSILSIEEKPEIEENYIFVDSLIKKNKELIKKNKEKGKGTSTAVYNQAHNGPIGYTIKYPDGTTEYRSNLEPNSSYNWFTNDKLNETIALNFSIGENKLHCAFHFINKNISSDMLNEMNLLQYPGKGLIKYDSINKFYIKKTIEITPKLNQNYFETISNIKIGEKTNKVYNLYGKPKEQLTTIDGHQKLKWFNNALKQELTIYSKNEVIIGIIIYNIEVYKD
ncbi:MAG: hypothetical protein ACI863_000209 [Flavobacteriales bacterium]|jgi:hypothetical protein